MAFPENSETRKSQWIESLIKHREISLNEQFKEEKKKESNNLL